MSDRNVPISKTLNLLRQLRDDLRQHEQWKDVVREIDAAIHELEAAESASKKGRFDAKRLGMLLARIAWMIHTLLSLH